MNKKVFILINIVLFLAIVGGIFVLRYFKSPERVVKDEQETEVIVEQETPETMEVTVFFNKSGNENMNCYCNYPVTRIIPKTEAIAMAVLELLISGPTPEEREDGYSACMPTEEMIREYKALGKKYGLEMGDRVKINSFAVKNDTVYVDFSREINSYGGDSCWAQSIDNGVFNTLEQFSTIDDVVISIEGETESILQP